MRQVVAVVLAGGRGERMGILCQNKAKPGLPFGGSFRVIDFTLSNVVHSQITSLIVLVDYQRQRMVDYLKRWHTANSTIKYFDVLLPDHGSYSGTANAVYQNLDVLEKIKADTVVILAADHIYKMDYRPMVEYHNKTKADVTIGAVTVPIELAHRFGVIKADAEGRILSFVEKPRIPTGNLVSMGIYVFNKHVLFERLKADADHPESPHDFGRAVIPEMILHHKAFTYRFHGYWQDIGTMEAYYTANMEIAGARPAFSLDGRWPVLTEALTMRPAQISDGGSAENSIVSPGCVIKGHVKNSVLSPGVIIEEQSSIINSVLLPNVKIGQFCEVESCIIDESACIEEYSRIGIGETLIPGAWDITLIGAKAVVPSHMYIGRNCKVLPGVCPEDFTTNVIPAGTTVYGK
jgi:glucose-1-phosphate adenylyltransferase